MTRIDRLKAFVASAFSGQALRERLKSGLQQGGLAALAALLAYVPAKALGVKEGFWGAITAISVLQTEWKGSRAMARDQFLGAAVGGTVAVVVLVALDQTLATYALAVVMAVLLCWLLDIASAARLAGVTATIVLLVPRTASAERMFLSRLSEVGWGICVAIAILWGFEHGEKLLSRVVSRRDKETL